MNNRTIIMIAIVAVVMMMGTASAAAPTITAEHTATTTTVVTFSEAVKGTIELGDWSIGGNVPSASDPVAGAITGTITSITFTHTAVATDATADVVYTADAGAANSITDTAATPNNMATQTEAATDRIVPTFTAATATTTTITVTFSENVNSTVDDKTKWTVAGGSTVDSVTALDGTGSTLTITLAAAIATDAIPEVTYTEGDIVDASAAANVLATATVAPTDGIVPTFTAARTALNTIVLTFSETVTGAAIADSFTVAGATSVTNSAPTAGTEVTLTTVGLTATDGTPNVGYAQATGDIADNAATPNEVADGGAIPAADQVAPTLVSAARVNDTQINVTMSEAVANLGTGAGGFTVAKNDAEPAVEHIVSAIDAGGSAEFVVLTVEGMAESGAAGVNVAYNATDANGTITDTAGTALATNTIGVTVAAWDTTAPTLVNYNITNTTITPPQTTSIDVKFSEQVSAIIKIEDAGGNLVNELYNSSGVTTPDPQIWDGTNTTDTQVPDGEYTVNVSGVSTATGLSVVNTSKTITVSTAVNQPPTAVIASPTVGGTYHVGDEVSFSAAGSSDPDGTIASYSWNFGDGDTGTGVSATHTYATAGSKTVTLTVTDNEDATNATTVTINVLETGAVSVTLYEGWNLIAVPVNDTNADTAAELALKIPGCKEVVKWNASTQTYDPYAKIVDDWTGTDFAITGGMGLFVNVEGDTIVGFTGDAWSCSP